MYKGLRYIYQNWEIPLDVIVKADISALKRHTKQLSEKYGYEVKYPEFLLTFVAMEFLEPEMKHPVPKKQLIEAAKELLELNIKNYPTSSNAYFMLGRYYLFTDNKELAIESIEKVLELNPDNSEAKNILRKIKNE
jgi:tetratricopeptide (TPR) repeat protein